MSADLTLSEDPNVPELLRLFAEETSDAAALSLARDFGGTMLYLPLPDNLHEGHRIVLSVGAEAAEVLCRDFGPGEISIPKGPKRGARNVHKRIWALKRKGGLTNQQIALKADTTERYVRHVLNTRDEPVYQYSFFDDGPE